MELAILDLLDELIALDKLDTLLDDVSELLLTLDTMLERELEATLDTALDLLELFKETLDLLEIITLDLLELVSELIELALLESAELCVLTPLVTITAS